jgi:branched-subunit amino acid aminotransferase/4-amino-4-deoxychorismate lyase
MTQLWCNGQWLDAGDFPASPADRGVTLGLGLFETLLALDGEPVFAERHLARLLDGCGRLGWRPDLPDLRPVMEELLRLNHLGRTRSRIRLAISGGSGALRDLALGADHLVWMTASPAAVAPRAMSAHLSPWVRNERSPLAGLKCASYAENLIALQHAARLGFEECLFLNTAGHLCEAATANVFLVANGTLLTPSPACGCLPGITRGVVIELANQLGIPCEEGTLGVADLLAADALFLTSATRGLIDVARVGDRPFPAGPVSHVLREAWDAATRRKICL